MEIIDPSVDTKHRHHWLEWIGLEEAPPNPDTLVPVVDGFLSEDVGVGGPSPSADLVAALAEAGIEAHRRQYGIYDAEAGGLLSEGRMRACVAVVVHDRDRVRATEIAEGMKDELSREVPEAGPSDFDDELTRQALEAGPPPPD